MAKSQDEKKEFTDFENIPAQKSRTPVLDNFSISYKKIIANDIQSGLRYFPREREIGMLLKTLLKNEKGHIAIVGDNGTGKETLIKCVANKIWNEESGTIIGLEFIKLELDHIIAGTKYRGQLEERVNAIKNEIERAGNIALYIPNLQDFKELDTLLVLVRSNIRIITTLTLEDAESFFNNRSLLNYFHVIKLSAPSVADTIEILRSQLSKFNKSYSVVISEDLIESVIEYSNLYLVDEPQPQKAISFLEEVCASIELNRFENPSDILHDLKNRLDQLNNEIEGVLNNKLIAVKEQDYSQAALFKESEIKLRVQMEELKSEITKKRKENRVTVNEMHLITSIHTLTGIDIEKIKNKEKIVIHSKDVSKADYLSLPQFEFLQTQSILQGHQIAIKRGMAFVLIPHNPEFDELFNHFIKPALELLGLTVLKADNIYRPGNILSQVWAHIRTSEILIADVSGQNSNVIFELGLCYGIQRCPILLTRDPTELPFNIRNLRYIHYENTLGGAHKLSTDLKNTVEEFLSTVRNESF